MRKTWTALTILLAWLLPSCSGGSSSQPCASDADCPENTVGFEYCDESGCYGSPYIAAGVCGRGFSFDDAGGFVTGGFCKDCRTDADCIDDGKLCNGFPVCGPFGFCELTYLCCPGESTALGVTHDPLCHDYEARACDPETRQCSANECDVDVDCSDAIFCNGDETCFHGLCFPPYPITRYRCAGDTGLWELHSQLCNEDTDECETGDECAADSDCSDGLFCNGPERCQLGFCFPASLEPCDSLICDDAGLCHVPNSCNEETDLCE